VSMHFDVDQGPATSEQDTANLPKFFAKKALGQHFLSDFNIVRKIITAAKISPEDIILEVGPGPGVLTRALMATPLKKLIVIEKDARFIENLQHISSQHPGRMQIIHGDALTISLGTLGYPSLKIIANLPYNVGTALVLHWLQERPLLNQMTLMLQKEVVERMSAGPNHKAYGRLSIITQLLADVIKLFDVPPQAFRPPPKVMSTVMHITPLGTPRYPVDIACLEQITALTFNQRRKMLRSSLKEVNLDWPLLEQTAGILPTHRPENLSVQQFCILSGFLQKSSP